jgi:hypothetical protein
MSKIFDPVLLEEIIQYSDDGNFDRIIAELFHRLSNEIRSIMGKIGEKETKESILYMAQKKQLFVQG